MINLKPVSVRTRFQRVVDRGAEVSVSTVVAFELWYGVGKSQQKDANTGRLETFFAGLIRLAAFGEEVAKFAGKLRAEIEATGRPIGAFDLLITGQTLRHAATLVTAQGNSRASKDFFGKIRQIPNTHASLTRSVDRFVDVRASCFQQTSTITNGVSATGFKLQLLTFRRFQQVSIT